MLVLSRKNNEAIFLECGNTVIKIVAMRQEYAGEQRMKIGIEAPQHVRILRGELYDSSRKLHSD